MTGRLFLKIKLGATRFLQFFKNVLYETEGLLKSTGQFFSLI